jgi:pSer/pThr/pTyr-binding forkhead associated (FHA) protein
MRIEVLVGSEDPVIHPLNAPKLMLGSSESCDIVVVAEGISRKHLLIQTEGDKFYVTDQGSTNGSYMNEERLVPGKKIEFTSFFPIRLGEQVLVSLLSDDELMTPPQAPSPVSQKKGSSVSEPSPRSPKPDSTSIISCDPKKSSGAIKTKLDKVEAKRVAAGVKAPPSSKKSKEKIDFLPAMAILIVLGAAYYHFFLSPSEDKGEDKIEQVGQVIKASPPPPKVAAQSVDLIPDSELPKKESYATLINDLKCASDVERHLCDTIPGAREGNFGVVQVGLTYNILLNADPLISEAKDKISPVDASNPSDVERFNNELYTVSAYLFLKNRLPLFDLNMLGPDAKVVLALYKMTEQGPVVEKVVAFYPQVFNREKGNFDDSKIYYLKKAGLKSLDPFFNMFWIY